MKSGRRTRIKGITNIPQRKRIGISNSDEQPGLHAAGSGTGMQEQNQSAAANLNNACVNPKQNSKQENEKSSNEQIPNLGVELGSVSAAKTETLINVPTDSVPVIAYTLRSTEEKCEEHMGVKSGTSSLTNNSPPFVSVKIPRTKQITEHPSFLNAAKFGQHAITRFVHFDLKDTEIEVNNSLHDPSRSLLGGFCSNHVFI